MAAGETSKAFRASIGRLRDHEVKLLHRWALQHCAMCAVLCGSKGTIVLVALKDTARTASSFARTIRAAMRGLGIATSKALAGHWCSLLTEQECLALCMAPPQLLDMQKLGRPTNAPRTTDSEECTQKLSKRGNEHGVSFKQAHRPISHLSFAS